MYCLIDCNNFFVSCERVFRPWLIGRPVIVLSNNDGCAVALSNEAKSLGFKRGDPYHTIRREADRQGVVVFSGNHRLYKDMSNRVMLTLRSMADEIEVYSIDEAFLEFNTELEMPVDYGHKIVRKVLRDTGIPVSAGLAPTKTLAKIAAHFAKKYPGYQGVCVIDTEEKVEKALELTEIGDVWGIGRRTARKLRAEGITTALQFARLDNNLVRHQYTIAGERTWRELNGEVCILPEHTLQGKKTITSSRSFARDIHDWQSLSQAVCAFASTIGKELREQGSYALEIQVYVATNRFNDKVPQYHNAASLSFPEPTADTPTLAKGALNALKRIYREAYGIKKAGMTVTRLVGREGRQPSLFADTNAEDRRNRLMTVIDSINSRQGNSGTVKLAGVGKGLSELTRHEHASRLFTTRLSDIIEVHV